MADEFIRGAKENGHEIYRFDSAHADIKICIGCNACYNSFEHKCIIRQRELAK